MENNEVKKLKNKKKIAVVILVFLILAGALVLILSYSFDDSGRSLIAYIEQGVVIVCALISGFISYCSAISNQINDIELEEKNNQLRIELQNRDDNIRYERKQFEEKWNKQKIDADLKAKARIEWIQNVRLSTSKFLSACFNLIKILDENEEAEINKSIIVAKEMGLLLILYYGPDKDATTVSEKDKLSLNFGKNNEICEIIKNILHIIERIFPKNSKEKHLSTIQSFKEQIKGLEDSIPYIEIDRHISQEDIDVWIKENVIDEDSEEYNEFISVKHDYHKYISLYSIEKLNKLISELIEKTRVYLKNEWDRAKKGE